MDSEKYRAYLKRKIALYEQYEKEDIEKSLPEAAYRAKIMKEAFEDALKMFNECDSDVEN